MRRILVCGKGNFEKRSEACRGYMLVINLIVEKAAHTINTNYTTFLIRCIPVNQSNNHNNE